MSDLISRQAALDALETKKDKSAKGDIGCFYNKIIQNAIDALKGLPPAQPTIDPVKHGEWIPHEETTELATGIKMTAKGYICSECGERFGYAWTWCGNCGAKMSKGDEEE